MGLIDHQKKFLSNHEERMKYQKHWKWANLVTFLPERKKKKKKDWGEHIRLTNILKKSS